MYEYEQAGISIHALLQIVMNGEIAPVILPHQSRIPPVSHCLPKITDQDEGEGAKSCESAESSSAPTHMLFFAAPDRYDDTSFSSPVYCVGGY